MIPKEVIEQASLMGFEELEAIKLRSGEEVYLIQMDGTVGLPTYLHMKDGIATMSTYDESMALFDEPSYMQGGE